MKSSRTTLSIIVLALSTFCLTSAQQNPVGTVDSFNAKAYRVGERLTYDVSFSQFISAAHIELQVVARGNFFGRDAIQLRGHAETSGVVNVALLALNNDYTSYIDPNSGLPFRTREVVRQGGHTSDISNNYNESGSSVAPTSSNGEFAGTYDLLSAIYRVRAMSLTPGGSYTINVRYQNAEYQAELRVIGHELVKTKMGSFNAIVVRLDVRNSSLDDNRTRIYFSNDERHIPLLIRTRLSAGEIRAELAASDVRDRPPAPRPSPSPASPSTVTIRGVTPAGVTRSDLPFKVGERLNYLVYLPKIDQPVGTAVYEVKARGRYFDHEGFLLSAKLQTTPAIGRLFTANDQCNSYVDPVTLLPFRTEMVLVEGNHRTNRTYTVDQDRGNAVIGDGSRIEIPVGTHDLVSLVYAVRTFELSPAKRNAISILVNNRPETLFITSLRRETIDLGGQKLPAVLLTLTTDDPVSDKYQLRAWVSDDSRRLPLRFTASTELGLVRADLAITPVTPQ